MKKTFLFLILAVTMLTWGCSSGGNDTEKTTEDISAIPTKEADDSINLEYLDSSLPIDQRVDLLLQQLTLDEKASQMLQAERKQINKTEMKNMDLGSILSGGGSYPGNNTVKEWQDMFREYQEGAMQSKRKIPMLYGVDAVHGHSLLKGAVVYPHNIGLGAANDEELMYKMGAAVAEEMKLTNILWNFAPCVAVSQDPRWGRTYESYSSNTEIVTKLSNAYLKGQEDHGIVSTVKHYVADGGTMYGTSKQKHLDRGDVRISEEELRQIHLPPYKTLVESGAKIVMASFNSYEGLKMHEHKYLLTDVLKKEFGFNGFIVSDWEALNELSGSTFEENVILSINAGVDMLMEPFNYKVAKDAIVTGVKSNRISMERIDDAVSRILKVKFELGLFEDPYMENITLEVEELGSDEYRNLAKQLVEKSLVLLKNDNQVLPLKTGQKVFVLGPGINDMGMQIGGWGLSWQGSLDNGEKINDGFTILDGLNEYAQKYNLEIITDKDRADEADVVLLAVGEVPYAEYEGDTKDLSITGEKAHSDNAAAIEYANSLNKPTVTLLVVGRNVIISDYMDDWDSVVMCYLPGTQGNGVASVLTGEVPFSGKLPMPYYKSVEDINNVNVELLFDVGYGLTY